MQMLFDLGIGDRIAAIRDRLREGWGSPHYSPKRVPVAALVKSIISCRTYDEVSLNAFNNLVVFYPDWEAMAAATPSEIEAVIADVTFANSVASYVSLSLQQIARSHPDFDLGFLAQEPVPKALAWLERLPGVGRKVSAAALNFSTLNMPALVIDTHVLRVTQRLRLVSPRADIEMAYDRLMAGLHDWSADDLSELHCLLKHLGQVHCRPTWPDCRNCPIADLCNSVDKTPDWRN